MKSKNDPAIARELRLLRKRFPDMAGDANARRVMERLAVLRCRFDEMNAAVREAGGAKEATAAMTAELRQLSRACSSLEQQLTKPNFETDKPMDAIALMAETRRMLIERARRRAIEAQATPVPEPAEQPLSGSALLRRLRDDRDLDG